MEKPMNSLSSSRRKLRFFRKSKTGRPAAVIRNRAGRFCAKESGTAGKFIPVFRFCEGRDFFILSLAKKKNLLGTHGERIF